MFAMLQEGWRHRELVLNLVVRNLKIRYKGSALGFFWTLANPLFMMAIYLIFIKLMRFEMNLAVLLVGILPWQFFVMCLTDSLGAVVGHANLVKKTRFPRVLLPLSTVLANAVNFALSLGVLFAFLLVTGTSIPGAVAWLPAVFLLQFFLCLGLSLLVSCSNVYFRDTQHLLSVALMAWFFLTPVIYPLSLVPERFLNWYLANPMAAFIELYRQVFLGGAGVPFSGLGICVAATAVLLAAGAAIFRRFEPDFADEL